MQIPEFEIENFLFHEMRNIETLSKNTGFWAGPYQYCFRQVNLGPYGIADLITIEYQGREEYLNNKSCFNINIIEIKSGSVNSDTYLQAIRYAAGIKMFFKNFINAKNAELYIGVCLIGHYIGIKKIDFVPIEGLVDVVLGFTYTVVDGKIRFQRPIEHERWLFCMRWDRGYGNQTFFQLFKTKIKLMVASSLKRRWDFQKRQLLKEVGNG